jgi:urease accessory protein
MRTATRIFACLALLLPALASAHTGDHTLGGFAAGFAHPLWGADHLAAMLAVGLWGALSEPRWPQAARAPLVFALALVLGACLAMFSGWVPPGVEPGIAVSLLGLGLLVAWRVPLPQPVGLTLVGVFALIHGAAHGTELQGAAGHGQRHGAAARRWAGVRSAAAPHGHALERRPRRCTDDLWRPAPGGGAVSQRPALLHAQVLA